MPFHQDVHETMMGELMWPHLAAEGNVSDICDRACDDREAIEQNGYNCDCTPIDTLMAREALGLNVAWAMEHGDEPAYT